MVSRMPPKLLLSHTHTLENSNTPDTHSPHFGGPRAAQQFPRKTAEVSYNLEEMWGRRGYCGLIHMVASSKATIPKI